MEFTAEEGEQRYAALVRAAAETVVGLDFDGTLAPIVEDPSQARIHPDAGEVLVDLAEQVLAVAVVTGRPARQALDLGGLEGVGNAIGDAGKELYLFGQYGNERWTSTNRRVISPRPPRGLASFRRELPRLAAPARRRGRPHRGEGPGGRRAHPPAGRPRRTFERLLPALEDLADRYDLIVEPGKQVIEVRSPGMHKGLVVERLVEELDAGGFVFVGDDLGDVEAFEAVAGPGRPRPAHAPGLLGLRRGERLVPLSDVVVHGPEGVLDLLRQLTARRRRPSGLIPPTGLTGVVTVGMAPGLSLEGPDRP